MAATQAERRKLSKRIRAFRAMVGEELAVTAPELGPRIDAVLARLDAPVGIVLAGLGNSAHYRLAELLAGVPLFAPGRPVPICPPLTIQAGEKAQCTAIHGGKRRRFDGCSVGAALIHGLPESIEIAVPDMEGYRLTVLPPYDDAADRPGYLVRMLDGNAAAIWCSDAATPWQGQERRFWFTVPDPLKTNSILALTGAERVIGSAVGAVVAETRAATEDDFATCISIAIDAARASAPDGAEPDAALHETSGGAALAEALAGLLSRAGESVVAEARALRADLDEVPLGQTQPVPIAPAPTGESPAAPPAGELAGILLTAAQAGLDAAEEPADLFAAVSTALAEIREWLGDATVDEARRALLMQDVREAEESAVLLAYEADSRAAGDAADLLRQIALDVWEAAETGNSDVHTPNFTEIGARLAAG